MIVDLILGILGILFAPPVLYIVTLPLIGLCILGALYSKFKEQIDPVIIAILDFIYKIVVCVVFVVTTIYKCIQRTVYPIKEAIISTYDDVDQRMNPYKKKVPYTHIPAFQY